MSHSKHSEAGTNWIPEGCDGPNCQALLGQSVRVGDILTLIENHTLPPLDLVYIDPPYFTKREHVGGGSGQGMHFNDRWAGGRAAYLEWLEARVRVIHGMLGPRGVFLLHLDWHAVHYAKVMCDKVFGDQGFQNEVIWYYQTGGASKGRFSRKHDSILFYAKGPGFYFNGQSIAIPRTEKAMKRAKCPTGARIKLTDTHKNPDDVLTIPALNPMAVERTGYPTQKPLALLETFILALCPAGGIVADFFCGSGTTLVAAKRLGRRYLGCDVSSAAVALTRKRLAEAHGPGDAMMERRPVN